MQQFRFGLQTLLRIRQRMEARAKNEFSDQMRRVNKQEEYLTGLLEEQKHLEEKAKQAARVQVDVAVEKSCADYSQTLWQRIEQAGIKLEQLKTELERRREALIQAQQEVKILEKLRERRYAEYIKEVRRREQYFLDEVASTRFQAAQE